MASFWLEDPTELFRNFELLPNPNGNIASKLNALTRLAILIGIGIFFLQKDVKETKSMCLITFGIILLFIVLTAYYTKSREGFRPPQIPTVEKPNPFPQYPAPTNLTGLSAPPLWYASKYGAGPKEYRDPPVIPLNPGDAKAWGGFNSRINEPRPQLVHNNVESILFMNPRPYSQKIDVPQNGPSRQGFKILGGPHENEPEYPFVLPNNGLNDAYNTRIRGYSSHQPGPAHTEHSLLSPSQSFVPGQQLHSYDGFNELTWTNNGQTDFLTSKMAIHRNHPALDTGEHRLASSIGISESLYNPTFRSFDPASTFYKTSNNPYDGLFLGRSNIEHLDMRAPNGEVLSGYRRMGFSEEDFMDAATSRQEADELYFRESMVADYRAQMNQREREFQMAPITSHFM